MTCASWGRRGPQPKVPEPVGGLSSRLEARNYFPIPEAHYVSSLLDAAPSQLSAGSAWIALGEMRTELEGLLASSPGKVALPSGHTCQPPGVGAVEHTGGFGRKERSHSLSTDPVLSFKQS